MINRLKGVLRGMSKRITRHGVEYDPLIKVYISKSALLHNFFEFKKANANKPVAPVIKSNAYGHGLLIVAKTLANSLTENDTPFFVVDSYFEALSLRENGIKKKILVIGYTAPGTIVQSILKDVSFTITSLDALLELNSLLTSSRSTYSQKPTIHLKIDTGMRRQGIMLEEVDSAFDMLPRVALEGVCSHFADADNPESLFTNEQIQNWNSFVKKVRAKLPSLKYWHISATSGHAYTDKIDANVSRLGLGLYGIHGGGSIEESISLKPALSMVTELTLVKKISKGDHVGYGCTFTAPHDMTIGLIPAGYFEGVETALSGKGALQLNGQNTSQPVNIVGRVSMNITAVDVTGTAAKRGDKVTIFSCNPTVTNSIENIAKICNTIPYKILVHIPQHLKRVLVD